MLASAPGVESVELVRLRWVGHELRAEALITSAAQPSLADARAMSEEAHHHLLHQVPRLREAIIHSNPYTHDGADRRVVTSHHFRPRP